MLDALVTACDMEKSFLFDVASKVYVATDSAPVDSACTSFARTPSTSS